jgi:hypothetical protein
MDTPRYSVKDVLILARESGLPEASVIALVNELINPQSKLLGSGEEPPSRESMLELMHEIGYTEYDDKIGTNGKMEGGNKTKKAKGLRPSRRTRRKT